MDILFLLGLFPKEYENEILKNSIRGVQNAANKFQWGIVNGFDKNVGNSIRILNSPYVGSYPKRYKEFFIPDFSFCHCTGAVDHNVGFCNLSGYKTVSRYYGLKNHIKRWANDGEKDKVIIAYAMTSPFVELLYYVKKNYPHIKSCLFVPDLPEYMNAGASTKIFYKVGKTIQINHFRRKLKLIDCYVFLTKYMPEWFDWNIRYTVVEGISNINNNEIMTCTKKETIKEKKLIYAGMIEEKYGLLDLVNAFMQINNDEWSLEIFGRGSSEETIRKLVEKDNRVHLRGMVSNDEVLEEQKRAELLINPRNDKDEFTKFSFPSKVIEYMSSGTPMIGYKLSGMPDEYLGYFFEVKDETDGLRKSIEAAMGMSSQERMEFGEKAKCFILEHKNSKTQMKKVIDLLNSF